jgi:hypothetical protein
MGSYFLHNDVMVLKHVWCTYKYDEIFSCGKRLHIILCTCKVPKQQPFKWKKTCHESCCILRTITIPLVSMASNKPIVVYLGS